MTNVCRNCSRAFETELRLELHRDTCGSDTLLCGECGDRFAAGDATRDGWHYVCPNESCDADGIGETLHRVDAIRTR